MVRTQIAEYFKQKRRIPQVKMVNWQPQLVRKLDDRRRYRFNPVSGSESHVLRLSLKSMNDQDSISLIFYIFFYHFSSGWPPDVRLFSTSPFFSAIAEDRQGGPGGNGAPISGGPFLVVFLLVVGESESLSLVTCFRITVWIRPPLFRSGLGVLEMTQGVTPEEIEAPRMCDAWHPTSPNSFGEEQ